MEDINKENLDREEVGTEEVKTEEVTETVVAEELEEEKMPILARFVKVITSPRQAFTAITQDPKILWPALIFIALNVIFTVVVLPETLAFSEETLKAQGMSADQIALSLKIVGPAAIAGAIIIQPIVWLIFAALLLLYNQFSVGQARFKQLFAVAIFSSVPLLILAFISTVLTKTIGLKSALEVKTSLALFLGSTDSPGFIYRLMSNIELFSIWGLILLILGGAKAMNKKPRNLAVYVVVIWLVYIVIGTLIGGTGSVV